MWLIALGEDQWLGSESGQIQPVSDPEKAKPFRDERQASAALRRLKNKGCTQAVVEYHRDAKRRARLS
jgi:hypothetical protein